jgi:tetratricopeptide (TPR) repeat protein
MIFCQACFRANVLDAEYCAHCGQKLLVVSGEYTDDDQEAFESRPEEQLSFDEHLLERISILEEVARRTAQGLRQVLGTLHKLEQKMLVCETGVTALRDLLEGRGIFARQEWSEVWEARLDRQLLALEKRDRFAGVKEKIRGLYGGDERARFSLLLDEAEHALFAFDIEKAMRDLEQAAKLDPRNHELSFYLGETCFNEGRAEEALNYFAQVLAQRPDHFESLVYCGVVCHEQEHTKEAQALLLRAAERYPEAFLPSFCLGAILASSGRLDDAVFFLHRATAVSDAIPQAFYLLGSCHFELGRTAQAIRPLEKAVQRAPTFADAHFLLGLAYLARGWRRKAEGAFQLALRLEPQGLSTEEIELILGADQATAADPALTELLAEAREHLRRGQGNEALAAYRRALVAEPDNPWILVFYALACTAVGRRSDVAPTVKKAIGLSQDERLVAAAYATMIEHLRADGRWRESTLAAQRLLGEVRSDLGRMVGCFELAATLADSEEDLDQALRYAEQALELAPAELRRLPLGILGWVLYKRGDFARAVICLTESNDLGSTARTLTQLGMASLAAGDKESARQTLTQARAAREKAGGMQARLLEALKDSARLLQDAAHRLES